MSFIRAAAGVSNCLTGISLYREVGSQYSEARQNMKSVAIFGTGSALKDFLSILPEGVSVAGLGDNDASRHGQSIEGHLIHSATNFARLDCTRFVIAARAVDPIRTQLEGLGVPAEKISAYYPSYSQSLGEVINRNIEALNGDLGLRLPAAGLATILSLS